ncbi:hypothetical protein PACTADRAFT_75355 [Pachysolen tannophilus NRRL Y-2460]|uniref:SUN-domain-containing protein n=1 Tax=Pachysolen tannophilus NRRL Y-2460 TaxID=669874 RepID=A0A1E4TWP9_PACTA|nr:hypothetical protein PACTADRAFT_75355 [Pachysolen tannophilus NRRL Y-2460]
MLSGISLQNVALFLAVGSLSVAADPADFKRGNTCSFPTNDGLVSITPNEQNGGWAMNTNQQCTSGNYCPYACPSGQLMAQWDTSATSYTYPESQYGGLHCNDDGTVSKPFSNKGYCYDGKGTVKVNNNAGSDVAFCQTVLPGNEAMLIPTNIGSGSTETIAVPGTEYWAQTAAHYYINPPGVSTSDACAWGTSSNTYGNWAPYVAGANMDGSQNTFVKIGWNPVYLSAYSNTKPNFGIRITCDDESKCNGLQCEIDPSNGVNSVNASSSQTGSGSAKYCVVTAEQGSTAKIEVFRV